MVDLHFLRSFVYGPVAYFSKRLCDPFATLKEGAIKCHTGTDESYKTTRNQNAWNLESLVSRFVIRLTSSSTQ